jgi:ribonuclease HI
MVATDGSLRLPRKNEEGETMGAGVAWQQEADMHRERKNPPEGKGINGTPREERGSRRQKEEELQSVSRRVAGNLSSTRAELAAIAQAVKIAPIKTDLIILIDSAAAIRRLTWFRRKDFRPHPRRTKDYDIVQEIVLRLDERGRNGALTTKVKVYGRSHHKGEGLWAHLALYTLCQW